MQFNSNAKGLCGQKAHALKISRPSKGVLAGLAGMSPRRKAGFLAAQGSYHLKSGSQCIKPVLETSLSV